MKTKFSKINFCFSALLFLAMALGLAMPTQMVARAAAPAVPVPGSMIAAAATGTYAGNVALSATLLCGGGGFAGRTISFTLNGAPVPDGPYLTDASGIASTGAISLAGINAGSYISGVGASFAGDVGCTAASDTASLTVDPKPITVTADDMSKVYGDIDPALTYTSTALVGSDHFDGALLRDPGEDVGSYDIHQGSLVADPSSNYTITFVDAELDITAKPITVIADDKGKVYGESDPPLTYTFNPALVGSDHFDGALLRDPGEDVGSYHIHQGSLDADPSSNYIITFDDGELVITPKPITVTAATDTKVYDGNTSSSGVPTISPALVTGDLPSFIQAYGNRNVGTGKTLIPSGSVITGGANYTITFVNNITGVITVKNITVTAQTDTKVYNGTTSSSVEPLITGTLGAGDSEGFTQAFNNKHVGTLKTLIPSGLVSDGNAGANYHVTFVNDTTGVINKLAITVTAVTDTKVYDGTTSSDGVPTIAPALVGGDTSGFFQTFANKFIGIGKTLTPAGLVNDGNGGANYNVTFVNDITGVITASTILTVDAASGTYGGTVDLSATLERGGSPISSKTITFTFNGVDIITAVTDGSGVASISGVDLSVSAVWINAGDYPSGMGARFDGDTSYNASSDTDSLTVGKRSITVTAATNTKGYDGTTSAAALPTITAGTLATGDNIASFTETYDTKNVGTGKSLIPAGVVNDGNGGANYVVTLVNNTTGVITQKAITVTAVTGTKVYDGNRSSSGVPTITFGLPLVGGDTPGFYQTFANKFIGTGKTLIPHGVVNDGNGGANYHVTFVNDTTGVINKLAITVTAVTSTKVYNGNRSSSGVPTISPALVGTDTSGFTQTFDNKNVGAGKTLTPAGSVNDGSGGANYTVTFVNVHTGVITTRPITVTADAKSKVYGASDPALTYTFSPALVGSDSFTGALSRVAGVNVGVYAIQQNTLAAGSNYTLTYVGANLSITPKSITVTANAKSKVYGASDPALTYTFRPALKVGDSFSGALSRVPGSNVGSYAIGIGSLTAGPNYALTYVGASLTITKKAITVTAGHDEKAYDGTTSSSVIPTITFGLPLVGGDTPGFYQTFANKFIGTGKTLIPHGVVNDGNGGANYNVTFVNDITGVIYGPSMLTANVASGTYGGTVTLSATFESDGVAVIGKVISFTLNGAPVVCGGTCTTDASGYAYVSGVSLAGNAGSYPSGVGASFAGDTDYAASSDAADLTVLAKAITVTAVTGTKVYDGNTSSSGVPTIAPPLVGTDTADFHQAYDNKNVGTGKTLTPAGSVNDGNGGANYTVTFVNNTTGVISVKAISVTAVTGTKVYDGNTSSSGVPTIAPGLGSGDTSGFSQTYDNKNVGAGKTLTPAGSVNDGNGGANYTVTFVNVHTGVITTRPITVTADAKSKVFGATDPALTYTVSPALAPGDSFTGALSRVAGEDVGVYAIQQNTLAAGSNYTLTYVGANLSITPKPITVTAGAKSKVFGASDPELTYTSSPALVGGDSFSGALSREAGEDVGAYAIQQNTLDAGSNYALTYVGANLVITKPSPILLSPSDGAILHYNRPTFDWADFLGATGYQIQVSSNAAFSLLVVNVNTAATETDYTPTTNLPADTMLYWRVRAKLGTSYSVWSSKWTLHTANPPSVPSLLAPANNALTKDLTPLLDWARSSSATFDRYQVQVDDNADFSSPVIDADVAGATNHAYTPLADLNPNTKYYWHVRAWNAAGDYSAWSAARSFREAILPPALLLPIGGVTVGSRMPVLDWSNVTGATGYTLQVSLNSAFTSLVLNVNVTASTSTYTPAVNLAAHKLFYWRVMASGPNGPSAWSAAETFHTP